MEGSPKKTPEWGKDEDGRRYRLVQIKGVQYIQFDNEKGPLEIRGQSTVQQQTKPRYVADAQHTTAPSQPRGEQSTHGGNVNYALYPSSARPVLHNETIQTPMFSLFPRTEAPQLENATPIPRQAYDLQASAHARNAQSRSHDRGSKYYASTHHGAVVVEPAVSRRSDAPAAPRSTAQASTNKTYSGTTKATGSHLSELGQSFAKLTCGDYGACQEFMGRYPGILNENQDDFQQEALRLQRNGNTSQVRNCVQQLLLLRKTSKMSGDERRTFFNRMKAKDPKTLKDFLLDFDKTHAALKTLVGAKQPNPTQAVKNKSEPEFVDSDDRRYGQVAVGIGHPPEAARRRGEDERMSASLDKLNINTHNQQDPARSYGAGGNGTRPPSVTYRSSNGRRQTLPSVDENSRPNFPKNNVQGAPPSVVDYDIRGDDEKREELDHRYYVRSDGDKFFKVGRVFAMLWHESVGYPKGGHLSNKEQFKPYPYREGKYGEKVYSHILRMVVVKERHGYCWCIQIHTYNGRGVLKPGFNQQDQKAHAIIHMDDTRPASTSEEEIRLMTKKPIAVCTASSDQKLHIMSRLNFGAPYSIQMNVKVMDVGTIAQASMSAFESYWRNECGGN